MSALDIQVGGSHYKDCAIQPIQYIEANNLKFLEACVIKRCTRHDKPTGKGRQDIEKAIHELQLLLDMRYPVEDKAEPLSAEELDFDEERIDRIAAIHGGGEHYQDNQWIAWHGGTEAPVAEGTIIDVRDQDGETHTGFRCGEWPSLKCYWTWECPVCARIVAYRIHA